MLLIWPWTGYQCKWNHMYLKCTSHLDGQRQCTDRAAAWRVRRNRWRRLRAPNFIEAVSLVRDEMWGFNFRLLLKKRRGQLNVTEEEIIICNFESVWRMEELSFLRHWKLLNISVPIKNPREIWSQAFWRYNEVKSVSLWFISISYLSVQLYTLIKDKRYYKVKTFQGNHSIQSANCT